MRSLESGRGRRSALEPSLKAETRVQIPLGLPSFSSAPVVARAFRLHSCRLFSRQEAVILVGKTILHYEIIEPLGAGGMGEVYRARDTKLERDVAIKVLPEDLADDPDRLARLQREAKLLAALNHPNIATVHALEGEEGASFLVLELVTGESLERKLAKGPLPVEKALDICKQVAEALEAAHGEGIIH